MSFIELKPSRNMSKNTRNMVRVSFPIMKRDKAAIGNSLILYIGKDIASQIGLKGGDKIKFYVDSDNPRLWWVKKSDDGNGYKILDVKRKSGETGDTLRIQMTWKKFKPDESEIAVKTVTHDFYEGGIRIYPSK
ncbi:hypothetical protein [Legionella bozemanae]|uniref:hypothetical protein n=1 Tax=Legionella bozemanae TaxID=447 RepID=UPI00399D22E0